VTRWNQELQRRLSPIVRYGSSVIGVAIALGLGLASRQSGFRDLELPLLALAIAPITWYGGTGPSVLAVVLSAAGFTYFVTEPLYVFEISGSDLPYFFVFIAWAVIVAWFVSVRKRIEGDLRHTRDRLQLEVEQRKLRESEIRNLNQELAERAGELEASNKELEAFAYSVSHDLRAPLRHSIGFSELLQSHASPLLDDKSRRYIQTIIESSKRMGSLIDDLLSFSRIGRAETNKTQVGLEQLVKEIVAETGRETKGRDIVWKINALPACYGDRTMLRLVNANLISNAVKFTRMQTKAAIEIGFVDNNQDEIELFVRDNGAGFDMRYANKLFGVFQRLHKTEEFEGTGIGLATVQRIVHRHGGKVRAEGAIEQGATFYFSLPRTRNAAERSATANVHIGTHFAR